jgi:hypothetical protein
MMTDEARGTEPMLIKERYTIQKQVRIPLGLYEPLVEESSRSGVGQPAVMARMILSERLHQGNLEQLSKLITGKKPQIPMDAPRCTVRLSETLSKLIDTAAEQVSDGCFTSLLRVVLTERYLIKP